MSAALTEPTANTHAIRAAVPLEGAATPKTDIARTVPPRGILGEISPIAGAAPSFGALLRPYRERAGLSPVALARRLGQRDWGAAVHRWERGERVPTMRNAVALADALGLGDDERRGLLALARPLLPAPPRLRRPPRPATLEGPGALVAGHRRALGISQSELGRRAGVCANTLNRIESGGRGVSAPMLLAVARGLGLADGERAVLLLSAGFVPPDLCDAVALPAIRRVVRTLGNLEGEARDQCAADLSAVCRRWARVPRHPALVEG